jgi:hypothetical protein
MNGDFQLAGRKYEAFHHAAEISSANTAGNQPDAKQATTVSCLTITSTSLQRDQVTRKTVQKSRSRRRNGGLGRFRFKTATCWRRAKTSTATSVRLWKKTRVAAMRARTNDSTDYSFNMM